MVHCLKSLEQGVVHSLNLLEQKAHKCMQLCPGTPNVVSDTYLAFVLWACASLCI